MADGAVVRCCGGVRWLFFLGSDDGWMGGCARYKYYRVVRDDSY